jgi:hypothetical protein
LRCGVSQRDEQVFVATLEVVAILRLVVFGPKFPPKHLGMPPD